MKQAVRSRRLVLSLCSDEVLFPSGGNLNAASRQALMQKLARTDSAPVKLEPV